LFLGPSSLLTVINSTAQPIWNTIAGQDSTAATASTVAGNVGIGTYPTLQGPTVLFDNSTGSKYASRGNSYNATNLIAGLNTGFYVTADQCETVLTGFIFFPEVGNPVRDPLTVTVEGTNDGDLTRGDNWHLLYNGSTGLKLTNRTAGGDLQIVNNTKNYLSYRFLVTSKRNSSDYVTYTKVKLYGYHG